MISTDVSHRLEHRCGHIVVHSPPFFTRILDASDQESISELSQKCATAWEGRSVMTSCFPISIPPVPSEFEIYRADQVSVAAGRRSEYDKSLVEPVRAGKQTFTHPQKRPQQTHKACAFGELQHLVKWLGYHRESVSRKSRSTDNKFMLYVVGQVNLSRRLC